MSPTPEAADQRCIEIGGPVRRIVIVTIGLHPCACYLARRLRDCGAAMALVDQRRPRVATDSWPYYRRLVRHRGLACAVDNLLLFVVKRLVGVAARLGGRPRSAPAESTVAALRPDPGIVDEGWLTYLEAEDINQPPDRDRLRDLEPDLILLAGAPILSTPTITLANVACLNAHGGLSPDYAGNSPVVWPLCDGRYRDIGFTVHLVVPRVDSGPILCQERVEWDPHMSLSEVAALVTQRMYDKLADIARELVGGARLAAEPQVIRRTRPPAGLFSKIHAEWRRCRYAARRRREADPCAE